MRRGQGSVPAERPFLFLFGGLLFGALSLQAVECEKPRIVGAGVLPYAVRGGEIVVLLGFDPGRGWTDFGGAPTKITSIASDESRCESHEEAALREGFEELRAVIDRSAIEKALDPGRYFPSSADPLAYRTYTIRIPFHEESTFRASWVPLGSAFDEKGAFYWVPLQTLVSMAAAGGNGLPGAPIAAPIWNTFWLSLREALTPGLEDQYFPKSVERGT